MTRHILEPVEFKHLLYGRRDTVATITINRPDNRNALGTDTVKELRQAFDQAKHDEAVRVLILTRAGKGVCAGAGLQGFRLPSSALDRCSHRHSSIAKSMRSPPSSPGRVPSGCGWASRPFIGCRT